MKRMYALLALALLLGAVSGGRAEITPAALQAPQRSATPAAGTDPGFAADVEGALGDLTKLQCRVLGLLLINSQPCPSH